MEKLYSSKTALKEYGGGMHHSTQRQSFTTTVCLFAKTYSGLSRTSATASPNPWGSVEPSLRTTDLIVTFKNCIIACLLVLILALCFKNLVGNFFFFLQVRSFKITARTDGVLHIINSVSL